MRMPGLNAEASLYTSKGRYHGAPVAHPSVPQVTMSQLSPKLECEDNCESSHRECWFTETPPVVCAYLYDNCRRRCLAEDPLIPIPF
jgi:hypothetical protein